MRISGINSPNYNNNNSKKTHNSSAASDSQNTSGTSPTPSTNPTVKSTVAVGSSQSSGVGRRETAGLPHRNQSSKSQGDRTEDGDFSAAACSPSALQAASNTSEAKRDLVPPSAKASSGASDRVQFFTQTPGIWNAYGSTRPTEASHNGTAVPDATSHKARAAISEYLQTQYIEERLHFTQVLGIDDYA